MNYCLLVWLVAVYELAVVCRCGLSVILLVSYHYITHIQVGFIQQCGGNLLSYAIELMMPILVRDTCSFDSAT